MTAHFLSAVQNLIADNKPKPALRPLPVTWEQYQAMTPEDHKQCADRGLIPTIYADDRQRDHDWDRTQSEYANEYQDDERRGRNS